MGQSRGKATKLPPSTPEPVKLAHSVSSHKMGDRLLPQFLSHSRRAGKTATHSCRNTLVWQWLDQCVAVGHDDAGVALQLMKKRVDMPRSFPNKKYLRAYMEKSRIDDAMIDRTVERLWSMYRYWMKEMRHGS